MSIWCCQWFKRMLDEIGEKGFSIIAYKDAEYRTFYLQSRPFEKEVIEDFEKVNPLTGETNVPEIRNSEGHIVPLTISQQIPLSYCPSCGADLNEIINKEISDFDALSEAHFPYRD